MHRRALVLAIRMSWFASIKCQGRASLPATAACEVPGHHLMSGSHACQVNAHSMAGQDLGIRQDDMHGVARSMRACLQHMLPCLPSVITLTLRPQALPGWCGSGPGDSVITTKACQKPLQQESHLSTQPTHAHECIALVQQLCASQHQQPHQPRLLCFTQAACILVTLNVSVIS